MQNLIGVNLGLLFLRVIFGICLLLHGISKIFNGIDGVKFLVTKAGLPEILSYGVYVGEFVAPILLILGIFSRYAAFVILGTCSVIIYTAHPNIFELSEKTGGLSAEVVVLYVAICLCIMFCGSGKFALKKD